MEERQEEDSSMQVAEKNTTRELADQYRNLRERSVASIIAGQEQDLARLSVEMERIWARMLSAVPTDAVECEQLTQLYLEIVAHDPIDGQRKEAADAILRIVEALGRRR